jgi:hypothetical protein
MNELFNNIFKDFLFLNFEKFTLDLSEKMPYFAICGKFARALLAHQIFYLPHIEYWFIVEKNLKKILLFFHILGLFMAKKSDALVNLPRLANRLTLTIFCFFCDAQPKF